MQDVTIMPENCGRIHRLISGGTQRFIGIRIVDSGIGKVDDVLIIVIQYTKLCIYETDTVLCAETGIFFRKTANGNFFLYIF